MYRPWGKVEKTKPKELKPVFLKFLGFFKYNKKFCARGNGFLAVELKLTTLKRLRKYMKDNDLRELADSILQKSQLILLEDAINEAYKIARKKGAK